jgi:hypothetical protein
MKPLVLAAAFILGLSACQSTRQLTSQTEEDPSAHKMREQQRLSAGIYPSAAWNWGKWGPWAPYPGFASSAPTSGE